MALEQTTYDELPYTCNAMPYAQPNQLATLAALFGINPPPVPTSRVLELGCGDGSNIIATAHGLPLADCWGIDLSAQHIAKGQAVITALGLTNLTLKQVDIVEFGEQFGKFDYIIAHGIFSWVSPTVQDKILQICQRQLTPNGIAYISYNTKPGWNMRGAIRDMMLYHTAGFPDPTTRVAQLKALLQFLANSTAEGKDSYSLFLNEEFKIFNELPHSYLFHEFLEEQNQPLYFYQFVERARAHQLEYLSDVYLHTMLASNFPPAVAATLQLFKQDLVKQEQYIDFLRNRHFRHTLLCHQNVVINRTIAPEMLTDFHIMSSLQPVSEMTATQQQFTSSKGTLTSDRPIVQTALRYLAAQCPRAVAYPELLDAVQTQLGKIPQTTEIISDVLLRCYSQGLIELHKYPQHLVIQVSAYPQASSLARYQAQQSNQVTNLRCELLTVENPVILRLLPHLDGKRDDTELLTLLKTWVNQGLIILNITHQETGKPLTLTEEQMHSILSEMLQAALQQTAKAGFLVA